MKSEYKGRPVDVYRNLHKNCWSIRDRETGRVWGHSQQYVVDHGTFVVQPAGRERVLKEKKKNVHAFVRGTSAGLPIGAGAAYFWGEYDQWRSKFTRPVTYNPYTAAHFIDKDGNPVEGEYRQILLASDGKAYIAPKETQIEYLGRAAWLMKHYPDERDEHLWDFHLKDLEYDQMRDIKDLVDNYMEHNAPEADYSFEANIRGEV